MAAYEQKTGGRVLAIPHNGNLSNGLMFDDVTLTTQEADRPRLCRAAQRWEPVYEVTQMKGDGETHPALSPTDEFANFETLGQGKLRPASRRRRTCSPRVCARSLKRGLAYEAKLGVNPFKFGMVGSTDHTRRCRRPRRTISSARRAARTDRRSRSDSTKSSPDEWRRRAIKCTRGRRALRASPRCGRGRTRERRSGTRWRARKCSRPPARACRCACSAASTSRPDDLDAFQLRRAGLCPRRADGRRPDAAPAGKAPALLIRACATPTAPISTASRSSRAGWTRREDA